MTSPVQALEVCNHGSDGVLEITWSDGITGRVAHRQLREACRCAHCTAAARGGSAVVAASGIRLIAVEAWGNNSLRLGFDDGHQRGLYPFDYLRSLAVAA